MCQIICVTTQYVTITCVTIPHVTIQCVTMIIGIYASDNSIALNVCIEGYQLFVNTTVH